MYDWDRFSKPDLIGRCTIKVAEFVNASKKMRWDLINPKKAAGGAKAVEGYINSGYLQGKVFA